MVESWEVGWRRHWCPRRTTSLCDRALSSPTVPQWPRSPGSPGVERWDSPWWTNFCVCCVCCVSFVTFKEQMYNVHCTYLDNRMRHQEVHLQHLRFVNKHSDHVLTWPSNITFLSLLYSVSVKPGNIWVFGFHGTQLNVIFCLLFPIWRLLSWLCPCSTFLLSLLVLHNVCVLGYVILNSVLILGVGPVDKQRSRSLIFTIPPPWNIALSLRNWVV